MGDRGRTRTMLSLCLTRVTTFFVPILKQPTTRPTSFKWTLTVFVSMQFFTPKNGLFGEDTEKAAKDVMVTGDPGQTMLKEIRLLPEPDGISIITPWAKTDEDGVITQCTNFEDANKISHGVCHLAQFVFERIPDSKLSNYVYDNKTTFLSRLNKLGNKWVNSDLDRRR